MGLVGGREGERVGGALAMAVMVPSRDDDATHGETVFRRRAACRIFAHPPEGGGRSGTEHRGRQHSGVPSRHTLQVPRPHRRRPRYLSPKFLGWNATKRTQRTEHNLAKIRSAALTRNNSIECKSIYGFPVIVTCANYPVPFNVTKVNGMCEYIRRMALPLFVTWMLCS